MMLNSKSFKINGMLPLLPYANQPYIKISENFCLVYM
jgi:hypothetical protein